MDTILRYFPELTDKQIEQIGRLQDLYYYWNAQINVISRQDIDNLYINHVLHSLSVGKLVSFEPNTTVLDVGTGGGFPGLPLAILFPEAKFHLIDSVARKVKVASTVAKELGLTNLSFTQIRAEQINGQYDFIVSRAVTALHVLYNWVWKRVATNSFNSIDNGILYLKGGDINQEIKQLPRQAISYPINTWFDEDYFSEKYIVHIYNQDKK